MAVFVAIHLPRLSLEAFRPRWSREAEHGCVVLERDKVFIADTRARASGVRLGMKRGGVLTLAPQTLLYDRDTLKEADLLRAVAFALLQFSPMVALCAEETVLVDVSASLRLFRGLRNLCRLMRETVRTLGVSGLMCVAPTGQGAWLLARRGRRRVLKMSSLERRLDALPFRAVPEIRPFAHWFDGLGCNDLSDVRRLPRAGLNKRCGAGMLDSMDRAYGLSPELFEWLELPPTFHARVELPDRVEHAEAILFSARRLISQMCGWLSAQQLALTHATLVLEHERGREAVDPTTLEIALAEPTWKDDHIVRLLKERLGRLELEAAVLAVSLNATKVEAAEPPSDSLFPEPGGTPEDHNRLLELLTARLGAENVLRPALTADHRPDYANRWVPVHSEAKCSGVPLELPRPVWLLEQPVRLLMKQHRPFYGTPLRLVSTGERVEAGWFDGGNTARDYFVAEAADKTHYWIFRERPSVSSEDVWYLHGLFG